MVKDTSSPKLSARIMELRQAIRNKIESKFTTEQLATLRSVNLDGTWAYYVRTAWIGRREIQGFE